MGALLSQGKRQFLLEVAQRCAEAKAEGEQGNLGADNVSQARGPPQPSHTRADTASAAAASSSDTAPVMSDGTKDRGGRVPAMAPLVTWQELVDPDTNHTYFINTASGESQWEPPLWVDEVDATSGAVYYVN